VAFIATTAAIVGVTVLSLGGVWRAQRAATQGRSSKLSDGASSP
jgi:hypothetical protein